MKRTLLATSIAATLAVSSTPAFADSEVEELRNTVERLMERIETLEAREERGERVASRTAGEGSGTVEPMNEGEKLSIYGGVHLSVDHNSGDFGDGSKGTGLKSNASRLGFKGAMPTLLDGTDLFYKAEVRYGAADEVDNEIEWREAYAGMRGGWGSLRAGRLGVHYKSTYTKIDPWTDNAPQARQSKGKQGVSAFHSSYFNNAMEYVTPRFNGVHGAVWYSTQFDGEDADIHNAGGPLANFRGGDAMGAGLRYGGKGLRISADVIDIDADDVLDDRLANDTGWQVSARYRTGPFTVAGLYEDVEDIGLGKNLFINGIYRIGPTRLIASYGRNRDAEYWNDRDIDTWSLGAKYDLTDKSELFAAYVTRDEGDDRYNTITVGVNAKFGASIW
ncbi:porin [Guyparkeria sp.]|uniref:porin n=1 Tax=Guyparkeria sp. TaxID=2035736 RepID=UPI0039706FE2